MVFKRIIIVLFLCHLVSAAQVPDTWQRLFVKASLDEVTHAYQNGFVWDNVNNVGAVFGGALGTYWAMSGDVQRIYNTNNTFQYSPVTGRFSRLAPMDRPPKLCGGKMVFDEACGRFLTVAGRFHDFYNGYLEPDLRLASLAAEEITDPVNFPKGVWSLDAKHGQWYAMRPLIIEGLPKGGGTYEAFYFNAASAKEYGLMLVVPPAFQMVYAYSLYFNQWTRLPKNAADTVFPPERNFISPVYDLKHHKMVIVYGNSADHPYTWTYDVGTHSFSRLALANSPTFSSAGFFGSAACAAYDRRNGVTIMVPADGSETWSLDLDSARWSRRTTTGRPPTGGNMGEGFAYDPAANRSLLFSPQNDEVWSYCAGGGIPGRPECPQSVAGIADESGFTVAWSASDSGTAPVRYRIFRAAWDDNKTTTSGIVPGPYALLDSTTSTLWRDTTSSALKALGIFHSYYVSAVSSAGLESDPSRPVFTVPPVPMGLTASPLSLNKVFLRWKPGIVAGYNIYRIQRQLPRHNTLKNGKLNGGLLLQPVFADSAITLYPTQGTPDSMLRNVDSIVMYAVTAVNRLGKESGFSPYALTHPDWVSGVWADTVHRTLNWSAPRNGRIRAYHVYEAVQVYGERPEMARAASVTDTFWSYAGRTPACYKIRAENDIGQIGFASDVLAIQAKDDDTFGNFRLDFQTAGPVPDPFYDDLPPIAVEAGTRLPAIAAVISAWPNPFSAAVTFSIKGVKSPGKLRISDCRGRLVASVEPGNGIFVWRAEGLPPGLYIAVCRESGIRTERKIVLLE